MKSLVVTAEPSQLRPPPSVAINAAISGVGRLQKPKRATVPALPCTFGSLHLLLYGKQLDRREQPLRDGGRLLHREARAGERLTQRSLTLFRRREGCVDL